MGFWIFILIMMLLIPVTMIGFGAYFLKKAPKTINAVFGYRTSMSMKNNDTWEFAHKYFGKIWYISGWILLVVTIVVMIFTIGKNDNFIGNTSVILCHVQMVALLVGFIPTERALKRTFDKDGKRRNSEVKI